MKKNIFLYLFIFSLAINVFAYMYFTNQQNFDHGRIDKLQGKLKSVRDSIKTESAKSASDSYFSLENNANAQEYFAGKDVKEIAIKVRDAIYAQNATKGGNPLVGYPAMEGQPFSVSKIKVLNHRWVIIDYSNGKYWGEALLRYFVEDNGSITLEKADTLLYPQQ
ncbi:hypothetical protein AM493_02305 [Flavobacterium akiainvivens]|uniref:Hydrolase n=1 Tax=Flavobacterium akiainvivens TaxID=1202724 RepID=A0A0M9VGZ4_9FLAO|nr:hypothetical protein [Flavobacterium akiainvivens]KOS05000.1 hypothetical protein AM493_02305 [Flavobacterium akiainvivens]SFQ40644.1 hypothetical protein SAMN05444144_10457 [Flavobacterium akiainvivens]